MLLKDEIKESGKRNTNIFGGFLVIYIDIWQQFRKHTMQDLRGLAHRGKNINVVPQNCQWACSCGHPPTAVPLKSWQECGLLTLDRVFLAAEVGRVHSHVGVHWEW